MKLYQLLFIALMTTSFFSCSDKQNTTNLNSEAKAFAKTIASNPFNEYWYQGKAEITSYDLEQARYGENHTGTAVLVFVTEDFSDSKQVKLDNPSANPKDVVKVLKLNLTKKFNTGVYPYSMMQSVFTPVELEKFDQSLKLTTSSQEWCGHTFTQLNLKDNYFVGKQFSYFESEGDESLKLEKALLEDEIWNRIRIAPETLPIGDVEIVPSLFSSRLRHIPLSAESAKTSLTPRDASLDYKVEYPKSNRIVTINFNKNFPHEINSWEESYRSGWGAMAKTLTTKATKNKSIMLDYWSKNGVKDEVYREQLGLD